MKRYNMTQNHATSTSDSLLTEKGDALKFMTCRRGQKIIIFEEMKLSISTIVQFGT